jgi:hypothetical protein
VFQCLSLEHLTVFQESLRAIHRVPTSDRAAGVDARLLPVGCLWLQSSSGFSGNGPADWFSPVTTRRR